MVHICLFSYKVCPFSSQSSNTDLRRRGRCRWSAGQRREAGGWRSRRGQRLVAQFLLLTSSWSCSTHTTWLLLYNHLCVCVCWSNPQMFPPFLKCYTQHTPLSFLVLWASRYLRNHVFWTNCGYDAFGKFKCPLHYPYKMWIVLVPLIVIGFLLLILTTVFSANLRYYLSEWFKTSVKQIGRLLYCSENVH